MDQLTLVKLLSLCYCVILANANVCIKRSPCSCIFPNGTGIDLASSGTSTIQTSDHYVEEISGTKMVMSTFYFHPCFDVPMSIDSEQLQVDTCNGHTLSLCLHVSSWLKVSSYGLRKYNESVVFVGSASDMEFAPDGSYIKYFNEASTTYVYLVCAESDDKLVAQDLSVPYNTKLQFFSRKACMRQLVPQAECTSQDEFTVSGGAEIQKLMASLFALQIPGQKGERGEPGPQGLRGAFGYPGISGVPGRHGAKGEKGQVGERGEPGNIGVKGDPGTKGPLGEKGSEGQRGDKGEKGDKGQTGAAGGKGVAGNIGVAGQKGSKGEEGKRGEKGNEGQIGGIGKKGSDGEKGNIGEKGVKGEMGIQGEKGDAGENGLPGVRGDEGKKGDEGEKGVKGDPGTQGNIGPEGPAGKGGAQGEEGPAGPPGPPGPPGSCSCDKLSTSTTPTRLAPISGFEPDGGDADDDEGDYV